MGVARGICILVCMVLIPVITSAQCAMCRTQLENNVSNGDTSIAAGINTGILYLLSLPYIAILILGYVWYRNSKNAHEKLQQKPFAG